MLLLTIREEAPEFLRQRPISEEGCASTRKSELFEVAMTVHRAVKAHSSDLPATLREHATLLPSPDARDFGELFDSLGDARIVLLGEATHGTHEFYAARAAITRRLIEQHGFRIVAIEGDWPDIARLDNYVRHNAQRPRSGEPFARFPTWMWRNEEMLAFCDWLRVHNAALPEDERASLRGLDIYSLRESIHSLLDYLDRHDPAEAQRARARFGCLSPWQDQPQAYGRAVESHQIEACEDAVTEQLQALLSKRIAWSQDDGEAFFDAERNARIIRAADYMDTAPMMLQMGGRLEMPGGSVIEGSRAP